MGPNQPDKSSPPVEPSNQVILPQTSQLLSESPKPFVGSDLSNMPIGSTTFITSRWLLLTAAILLMAILISGAYFLAFNKSNKPVARTGPRATNSVANAAQAPVARPQLPTINAACIGTYNDKNLCQYFANPALSTVAHSEVFTDVASYQGQTMGPTTTSTYETDGKGNSSYLFTQGTANITVGAIELGGNLFIKSPPSYNTWTEFRNTTAEQQPGGYGTPPNIHMAIAENSPGATFKTAGMETCGSLECYKYLVSNSNSPGIVQTIWFDNSNFLLRQWGYDTTQSPQALATNTSNTGGTPGSIITDAITYQPVTIAVPSS